MKRHLTPLGKITVIKTFNGPVKSATYGGSTIPSGDFIDMLNKKLYKFLWDGKPEKIKRTIVTQTKINGGLKMLDIDKFIQALKCSWIKRLVSSGNSPWAKLFQLSYGPISSIFNYGPNWGRIVITNCQTSSGKSFFLRGIVSMTQRKLEPGQTY